MKKSLITGINGRDGSYLAELLLEKGYEVWGLDECYASEKIVSYPNQSEIKHLEIFWDYWHPRRIDLNDNINCDFNLDLLNEGYYSELTCKGYEPYQEKINLVLNSIKHNN